MLVTLYSLLPDNDCYRLMYTCANTREYSRRSRGEYNRRRDQLELCGKKGCARNRATARCEMHFLRQYLERF